MQFESIQLENKNRLNRAYRTYDKSISSYFQYDPFNSFTDRLKDLEPKTYQRENLADVLTEMNKKWEAPVASLQQIERLKLDNSVVVIGGQQAGLLTGPSYSLHKIISIMRLAKEQEEALHIPVIPVFWIAGEDHDFEEINHVFSVKKEQAYKHTIQQQPSGKQAVADIALDKDAAKQWLRMFLNDLPETVHTKGWYDDVEEALIRSESYVDFFARLIYCLFPDQGLVLFNAHDPAARKLESDYFNQMITHQEAINTSAYRNLQSLEQAGMHIALDIEETDGNLFYHDEAGERILLKYEEGKWAGKNDEVQLSTEEMHRLATEQPEKLSNNVITRPLMQEMMFPTLAFVAGDGEINYWAVLKDAFIALDLHMPPVVPRLSFTYITNRTEKLMHSRAIKAEAAVQTGVEQAKLNWLQAQTKAPVDVLFEETKKSMAELHTPLRDYASTISPDLYEESKRNLAFIQGQIDYLHQKTTQKLKEQYAVPLMQFQELQLALHPRQVLQERIWNPYFYLNQYGDAFIRELLAHESLSFQEDHYLVYVDHK